MTRPRGRMPVRAYRFLSEYHYLRTRKTNKRVYMSILAGGVQTSVPIRPKHLRSIRYTLAKFCQIPRPRADPLPSASNRNFLLFFSRTSASYHLQKLETQIFGRRPEILPRRSSTRSPPLCAACEAAPAWDRATH